MSLRFILTVSTLVLPVIPAPQAQAPLFSPSETLENHGPSLENARANAPHIFNAIHSSMRQWGSSLNHNGMSFFPARIPNNTHLYHGTHTPVAVTGMEWLAFEIEHAEMFSNSRWVRHPGNQPGEPGRPRRPGEPGGGRPPPPMELDWAENLDEMYSMDDNDPDIVKGYLHIYRTTRPLTNLLYIDGMSAGKTPIGTLDTQDLVLRNSSNNNTIVGDYMRGQELCALGAEWGIGGFVRMEMGFEIIFCKFSDGLELESARQRPSVEGQDYKTLNQFEVLRGAALRYPGITAQRLRLDYSSMVSAFWYDLNLTNPEPDKNDLPRLPASDTKGLARMKRDVKMAFEESRARGDGGNDWQGVVDMIVTRYSDRLQLMAGNDSSRKAILTEIGVLLNLFVDYERFDIPTAIEKCSMHYLGAAVPQTASDRLIHEAILSVTNKICSKLFHVRELLIGDEETADHSALEESKSALKTLLDYLRWSTWSECGKCAYDEVCFVAIWPWGAVEDHEHPRCMKDDLLSSRHGYWEGGR